MLNAGVPGVAGFDLIIDLEASAAISGTIETSTVIGIDITKSDGVRAILSFQADSFSFIGEASYKVGMKVRLGVYGEAIPINGYFNR